jgi:hypothetical protein
VRGIDPARAEQNVKDAMIQFVATEMQEAAKGASSSSAEIDYRSVGENAIKKIQIILKGIRSDFEVEVQKS